MNKITVNNIYDEILEGSYGFSYGAIWENTTQRCKERGINVTSEEGVNLRKGLFLGITERLLKEGKAKLHWGESKDILTLSIKDQIKYT